MMTTTILLLALAGADTWGPPAVVTFDEKPCVTYRAQLAANGTLLLAVKLETGWHTFTMDNDKRATAKLAGKKALGADKPTEVLALAGLEVKGPWKQSPPKDFSQPELRIFSWGFEKEALFAAPAALSGGPASVRVKAQACTATVCKNIDITVEVAKSEASAADLAGLIAVQ